MATKRKLSFPSERATLRVVEDTCNKYNQEKPVFQICKELQTDKEK